MATGWGGAGGLHPVPGPGPKSNPRPGLETLVGGISCPVSASVGAPNPVGVPVGMICARRGNTYITHKHCVVNLIHTSNVQTSK
jgi:hypothetical protein